MSLAILFHFLCVYLLISTNFMH